MSNEERKRLEEWWQFRFSVVSPLLSNPPVRGTLRSELKKLAQKDWLHPVTGVPTRYSHKTIEEWYYKANASNNPVDVLNRKRRCDSGDFKTITEEQKMFLRNQFDQHKSWSCRLHYDNMIANEKKIHGPETEVPSYQTVRRYMRSCGMDRRKRARNSDRSGACIADSRLASLETRSYESAFAGGLWHLDFHHGSKKIVTEDGQWITPILLGILDDHSRLVCHVQWYLHEDTCALVHGFTQALAKRGLPRELMSDNGSAMVSGEFTRGLKRLSIKHDTTLPYSPHQNGKQECFWGQVEGRFVAMLENYKNLTLKDLNDMTQAWVEMEYNRKVHSETGERPIDRFYNEKTVMRPCLELDLVKKYFMREEARTQRKSDGTLTICGKRFEVPSRYRHLSRLIVCYAQWDLSTVFLFNRETNSAVCQIYPLDKVLNAEGVRRSMEPVSVESDKSPHNETQILPPLLEGLIEQYNSTGLMPAYVPDDQRGDQ